MRFTFLDAFKTTMLALCAYTAFTAFFYFFVPPAFTILAAYRIHVPTKWLSSFRVWSVVNWLLWLLTGYTILRFRGAGRILSHVGAFALLFTIVAVGDWNWTISNHIKWLFLKPYPDWIRLQPLLTGVTLHFYTLMALFLCSLPILLYLSHRSYLNLRKMLLVGCICWFLVVIRILISPSPAYTDWGYLTVIRPELQKEAPKYLVFFLNDVLGRVDKFLILLCGGIME